MIKDKIFKLRNFKIYDYSRFEQNEKSAVISFISRESHRENGRIVKIGKGKFYKIPKGYKPVLNRSNNRKSNPIDRYSLQCKKVLPSKYHVFIHLFYSNRNVPIDIDKYICRVIIEGVPSYAHLLSRFFGRRKVIEVYFKYFKEVGNVEQSFEMQMGI